MKKIIKMSLIAATAVAGFSTTASAKSMEDAIKNVDVSGYVRYRYTNQETKEIANQYRVTTTIKSKVNDNISTKLVLLGQGTTKDSTGDADPVAANIVEANFIYTGNGITAIVGKQALATPFADGGIDSQQGTGIVALAPVGPVTLAAGWYTNSDAVAYQGSSLSGHNITAIAAIGKASVIDYALWYANISEHGSTAVDANGVAGVDGAGADAVNVNVKGTFGPVSVEANYASVDYTGVVGDTLNDQEQSRLVVSAKAGVATVTAGVVVTGEDGGNVTLGDTDAKANFILENLSASAVADDTVYYLGVKAPVGPVTLGAEYAGVSDAENADGDTLYEAKLSAAYKMSKNFNVSGFVTDDNFDHDTSRIEVKYTF